VRRRGALAALVALALAASQGSAAGLLGLDESEIK
jgi:hypothetical protein